MESQDRTGVDQYPREVSFCYTTDMSIWLWVFVIAGGILIFGQRLRMKRRYSSFAGQATPESEVCHRECVELLREALASGDEELMRQAMETTTKRTLHFIPISRPYPETELENECSTLWHRAATIVHGELPTKS